MSAQLKPAYDLLDRAVADGAFPGGVLAVGWNDELAMHPFGNLTRDAKSARRHRRHDLRCRLAHEAYRHHHRHHDARAARRSRSRRAGRRAICRNGRRREIRSRSVLARARHRPNAAAARFRPARASRLLQASQEATSRSRARHGRAACPRARQANRILRPRIHSAGRNRRAAHRRFARRIRASEIFAPLANEKFSLQSAARTFARASLPPKTTPPTASA